MITYALDTNIISYFLREDAKIVAQILSVIPAENWLVIPSIAYYEIRRGLLAKYAPVKTTAFENLCHIFPVGVIDRETCEIAAAIYADLRQSGTLREDADILIAAFCRQHDYTLVTNNVKHFTAIARLKIVNWLT